MATSPKLPLCEPCKRRGVAVLSAPSSQALGGFNAAWVGVGVLAIGGLLLWALRGRGLHAEPGAIRSSPAGAAGATQPSPTRSTR